jgi:hypothetical protein
MSVLTADKAEELVKIKEDIANLKEKYEKAEIELIDLMKESNQSRIDLPGFGVMVIPEYKEATCKIKIKKAKFKKIKK